MTQQISIDFAPGVLEQYETLLECMRADALNCGRMQKAIAADMDMSPSELTRRLNDAPELPFRVRDLEAFLRATGGKRTLQYLVQKYLAPEESAQERAVRDLAKLAPTFIALAHAAGLTAPSQAAKARR